jgi:hypothetical protein
MASTYTDDRAATEHHAMVMGMSGYSICTDDGAGICTHCHVAMERCDRCSGIGYHLFTCPDNQAAKGTDNATS